MLSEAVSGSMQAVSARYYKVFFAELTAIFGAETKINLFLNSFLEFFYLP